MPFASEEALIEEANDSCYALAAGIWTRDFQRAWRLGRAVQAGTVWINTYKQFSISTPSAAGATAAWAAKGPPGDTPVHGAEEPLLGPERTAAGLGRQPLMRKTR